MTKKDLTKLRKSGTMLYQPMPDHRSLGYKRDAMILAVLECDGQMQKVKNLSRPESNVVLIATEVFAKRYQLIPDQDTAWKTLLRESED